MIAIPSWSIPILLHAVSVSAPTVPARGEQEAVITLDAAAMVRLSATSGSGTRCTVVDHVRGPFATSGAVGKTNCQVDLLLDQGSYKLRLESPARGKGTVKVTATPFTELHPKPFKLSPRQRLETSLKSGQQASFWLSVASRETPYIRITGRAAGEVKLWRNGEWLEEAPLRRTTVAPRKNKNVHEWWLDRPLDAGDYLVTVYGTNPLAWAGGGENDALEIERGFTQGGVDRQFPFTLPESGVAAVEVPTSNIAALLTLKATPSQPVELHSFAFGPGAMLQSPSGRCRLEPKTLVPECSASTGSYSAHVVMVRGEPGTSGVVEWAPWGHTQTWRGGYYGAATEQLAFSVATSGTHLVGLHDLPADTDAAPLGCQLEQYAADSGPPAVLARDVMRLEDGQMFDREFNYPGGSAFIWFEIKKGDRYRLQTKGERKSRCEVFRLADGTASLKRLTQSKPDAKSCNEALVLSPGVYQLSLYEGLSGVERLIIREDNQRTLKPIAHKGSCLIPEVPLSAYSSYRLVSNRVGAVAARGLVVEPLPLQVNSPLHVLLDPGTRHSFPVGSGKLWVRGAGMPCEGREGNCAASVENGRLTLTNPTASPIAATVYRPGQQPPAPKFEQWAPAPKPLQRVPLDAPTFFDFERNQSHSMVFDVETPGLYHVTTQGLLSTVCRLRTPVVPSVAADTSGGRGRNCLVAGYLRPGRYMLTVGTVGASKGRGAVLMTRRAPKELPGVAANGESFFRVAAQDLVQQKLVVKKVARYALSTTAQGVGVQCRLDDSQGWPVEPVPSACTGSRWLKPGSFLWTQLPLTIESMRRTRLERERPPVVLKGSKSHPINYFTWYRAELFKDGKDEFLFELTGAVTLDVVLTDGMQGRIEVREGDKFRAVEVIPPRVDPRAQQREQYEGGEGEGGEYDGPPPESAYEEGSGDGEGDMGEGGGAYEGEEDEGAQARAEARERAQQAARERAQQQAMAEQAVPKGPEGVKVTLPPGKYRLVTQHSKGDVGVSYSLHVSADALLPNMARTLPVPSRVPLIVPVDGTLRLRTTGEADVRCRLLKAGNAVVFESSENGADWNCAAAEPVPAGKYTLLLESETQLRGETTVLLALAASEDKPAAKDGTAYEVKSGVLRIPMPAAGGDSVHELGFSSKTPISCGIEDPTGKVVWQRSRVTNCAVLVRPKSEAWKVRLWTTDGSAKVTSTVRTRAVVAADRGGVGDKAALVRVAKAGRYQTGSGVMCLPEARTGPLKPCGPDASFEAGGVIFAGVNANSSVSLDALASKVAAAGTTSTESIAQSPTFENLEARGRSVFLLSATVGYGERAAPSCAFEGADSVRELKDSGCFAASAAGSSAVARFDAWTPDEAPVPTEVKRAAVAVPSRAVDLAPGRQTVSWAGEAGLFALPPGQKVRAEVLLPAGAWAVLLSSQGAAVDLCAPGDDLRRCVFNGEGHQLLLSGAEARAEISLLKLDVPETRLKFAGLFEDAPGAPGVISFDAAPTAAERQVQIEGAVRCLVVLADGRRTAGCKGLIPSNKAARIEVEHSGAPLRVLAFAPGDEKLARLNDRAADKAPAALEAARVISAGGARMERTLTVARDSMVRVRSDSGVCGLFRGGDVLAVDGLGRGCDVARLLPPGTYRLVLRPFGAQALKGGVGWSSEPVATLADGVGKEEWIAPGEVRLFRFDTSAAGKVGLGVQVKAEALDCTVYDDAHQPLGEGCQQYLTLNKGRFLLSVRLKAKPSALPLRFRPVLLGLAGTREEVPEAYLKDLFSRIGEAQ
jgi:hypothetical protein